MSEEKDPPIQPQDFVAGVKVVDFGDLRVARGLSRRAHSLCAHMQLIYDKQERRIWCQDCERDVEAFDAFEILVANYSAAQRAILHAREQVKEAREHVLHLIACKVLEGIWRGRKLAPTCPHCRGGLLPEDFATRGSMISAEIERQRRKKGKK